MVLAELSEEFCYRLQYECRGTISPNDDNLITDSFNTNVRNQ